MTNNEELKWCGGCIRSVPVSLFYKCSSKGDGMQTRCKACQAKRHAERWADPELRQAKREKDAAWFKRPETAEKMRARASGALKSEATRPMVLARVYVNVALRRGKITKGACSERSGECGGRIEGHHRSYAKEHWLDVVWLCKHHHQAAHLKLNSEGK